MTDLQWEILDQAYLMNDYKTMFDNAQQPVEEFNAALAALLSDGLLRQLVFSNGVNDFVEQDPFDPSRLADASYVISKKGLIAHTAL